MFCFKLLSLLVTARLTEQEWTVQFSAQYGGRETGGGTSYVHLRYKNDTVDKKLEAGFTGVAQTCCYGYADALGTFTRVGSYFNLLKQLGLL